MNKEAIEKRIAVLNEDVKNITESITQLNANLIATNGALQDCQHWLKAFEDATEKKKSKPKKAA